MKSRVLLISKGALVGVVVAYLAIAVGFFGLIHVQRTQDNLINTNHLALEYICSTSGVLDELVVAAANQLHQNFQAGTYAKLRAKGILTQSNLDAARVALRKYEQAHRKLSANQACRNLR